MSTKQKKQKPPTWASLGTDGRFSIIYDDMRFSDAWASLTPRQRELYSCMVSARHRKTKKESKKADSKAGEFFFNHMRWKKYKQGKEPKTMPEKYNYALYSDEKSFYKDRDTLIERGFIKLIATYAKGSKEKNLYAFDDKWKFYKRPPPEIQ